MVSFARQFSFIHGMIGNVLRTKQMAEDNNESSDVVKVIQREFANL
jgi:hypothetical protein